MTEKDKFFKKSLQNDEIDLHELIRFLLSGKWLITSIAIAFLAIAVGVALYLPNVYKAEVLLAPSQEEGGGGLDALASQYGGLANLVGVNIGGGASDRTDYGLAVLQSRKFISDFILRHQILVPLVASARWNADTRKLVIDGSDYDVETREWVRSVRPPKQTVPTLQEAYDEFIEILEVRRDADTGFVSVSIRHQSPKAAQQWVTWLVEDLNATVMSRDVTEAEKAIEFLNKQIISTPLSGMQEVFYSLIEDQTKTVLLAQVSDEYLMKTIDPAIEPEFHASPNRILIIILGAFFGGVIGLAIHFLRYFLR